MTLIVGKVGGSLFDLPDLRQRLRQWLTTLSADSILLVPGGGATANVIRDLDRNHGLGETASHHLALRCLTLNAAFLSALLDNLPIIASPRLQWEGLAILDAAAFCEQDVGPDGLPACWDATSDAIAARAAIVSDADELVLLKSVDVLPGTSWEQAAMEGIVDPFFPALASRIPSIQVVNLRKTPSAS